MYWFATLRLWVQVFFVWHFNARTVRKFQDLKASKVHKLHLVNISAIIEAIFDKNWL
jgi:hypothetical protein